MSDTTSEPLPRTYPPTVDVAIVGSGPAGAAYARILSENAPDASIVVFELGATISDPPGAHVKNIADPHERARAQRNSEGPLGAARANGNGDETYEDRSERLVRAGTFLLEDGWQQPGEEGMPALAFSSNVGGMGAHWTGACPRPGESERIGFLQDLDELLTEAERLLSVTADALADAPLAGEVRKRLSAVLDEGRAEDRRVQPMPLAVHRRADGELVWSGADVVFGDATRSNPNATLFDESLVTRVLVDGGSVRGVRVRDQRTGHEQDVTARFVVVAADALRSPQLLFASKVRAEALGRYLNDQPQIVYATVLSGVDEVPSGSAGDTSITAQSGVSWVPFTDAHPFHGQVMQLDASPVPLETETIPGSIVGLGWFCAKDLQSSDRVEFTDTAVDVYGMPAMKIHYTLTARDHANLDAARASIVATAHALGAPLGDEPLTFPAGASLHYQGTVRMGEQNDGTSVCDTHSQVWGVKGLHVAGNGVIPTATACNPTLTAVALAIGGARHIAAQLTDRSS